MPFSSNHNSYGGLALPNAGAAHFQQDSTKDALTVEHTSDNAGRFITFRDYQAPSQGKPSTIASNDVAWIDADGGFVGPKRATTESAADSVTLTSTRSGEVIVVNGHTSGQTVVLPTPVAGMNFTIVQSTGHSSTPLTVARGSSAQDILFAGGGGSSAPTTAYGAQAPTTAEGAAAEFIAINGSQWLCAPKFNVIDGSSAAAEARGGWVAASS